MFSRNSNSVDPISSLLGLGGSRAQPRGAGLFSMIFGGSRKKKLTRAQRRKRAMRKRRQFVDVVIMHHQRLHEGERQTIKSLIKRKKAEKALREKRTKQDLERKQKNKWREKHAKNSRAVELLERVRAKRPKTKTTWKDIMEAQRRKQRGWGQTNNEDENKD